MFEIEFDDTLRMFVRRQVPAPHARPNPAGHAHRTAALIRLARSRGDIAALAILEGPRKP